MNPPTLEALETRVAALEAEKRDMIARFSSLDQARKVVRVPEYEFKPAWWRCDLHSTGTNYTAGTDWDDHFEDITNDLMMDLRLPTLDGSINASNGADATGELARRLRIAFDSEQKIADVPFWIRADFGRIQVRINGPIVEYTAHQDLTFTCNPGPNWIQVIAPCNVDHLRIWTPILDQPGVVWRDPEENDDLFNPFKMVGGGGGGGGGGAGGTGASTVTTASSS